MLTAERLREVLNYDPETGVFTWKESRGSKAKDQAAGSLHKEDGYIYVRVDGVLYKGHRLVWLYMTGARPHRLDHKDGKRANNSWSNLREATNGQNMMNTGKRPSNKSGLKGVSWAKVKRLWRMDIAAYGVKYHAMFDCPAAAHLAYVVKSDQLHGEFGRTA
jgi:hypothetical protein